MQAFPHVVFASDVTDASLGMVTAPSIEGLGEYKDAGRRQLAVYQQMVAQKDPLAEKISGWREHTLTLIITLTIL